MGCANHWIPLGAFLGPLFAIGYCSAGERRPNRLLARGDPSVHCSGDSLVRGERARPPEPRKSEYWISGRRICRKRSGCRHRRDLFYARPLLRGVSHSAGLRHGFVLGVDAVGPGGDEYRLYVFGLSRWSFGRSHAASHLLMFGAAVLIWPICARRRQSHYSGADRRRLVGIAHGADRRRLYRDDRRCRASGTARHGVRRLQSDAGLVVVGGQRDRGS